MSIENDVRLIGNIGNDPDMKYTQGGTAICKISLATTSRRKGSDGTQQEFTEWHRVTAFGKLAEIIGEHKKKGDKIAVAGSIRYGSYEKDGVKHYTTDIVADQVQFLGSSAPREPRQAPQRREPQPVARQQDRPAFADDFADDDIPF